MKIERMFSDVEEERLYSTGNDELDDLLERAFCEGYEYAQKEFAWRHHIGIVVGKDEIRKLKALNYPKLYVGFLDKVNPLVQELSNLTGEDELVHAAIIYELDEGGEPYTEIKDGKEYKCFFYNDLNQAADFGYSEIAGILWCDNKGDWYRKGY